MVCRPGATTLAEITAAGKPAILVPLPTATDDHQRKNAQVLAQAGAAEVIDQTELSGNRLAVRIFALAAEAGYEIREKRITRDEVYVADEAFFTGTAAEVVPIRMLDGRNIGSGESRRPIASFMMFTA